MFYTFIYTTKLIQKQRLSIIIILIVIHGVENILIENKVKN